MDYDPPASSVLGILQARILEWEDLPKPGVEPMSPVSSALKADSLSLNHQGSPPFKSFRENRPYSKESSVPQVHGRTFITFTDEEKEPHQRKLWLQDIKSDF